MVWRLLLAATAIALVLIAAAYAHAHAQVLTARAEDVRFQLVTNEPIAAPEGRSIVAGTSALVLKDRRTGECFAAVTVGSAMAMVRVQCGS
jgi:hypothetical protein